MFLFESGFAVFLVWIIVLSINIFIYYIVNSILIGFFANIISIRPLLKKSLVKETDDMVVETVRAKETDLVSNDDDNQQAVETNERIRVEKVKSLDKWYFSCGFLNDAGTSNCENCMKRFEG